MPGIDDIPDPGHPESGTARNGFIFRIKWYSEQKEYASHTKAKSIEYLETIIKHENAGILEILESIRFDDGLFCGADYVFRIGEPANALYKILEGKAELLDQDQKRIQLLEPPFGIGFGFIIRKTVRSYDLRCIEDSRMVKITSDDFNEILELNPRVYKNIFEILLAMVDKDIYRL